MTETMKANRISETNINLVNLSRKRTGMLVSLDYNNTPFLIQTPYLTVKNKFNVINKNIYNVETHIYGESKSKTTSFYNFINNLETHITNKTLEYGKSWFGDCNVFFKSMIKKDTNTTEYIKWPVNFSDTNIIDTEGNIIDPINVKEGDLLRFIIEISDLWISDATNNFGMMYVVQKIMIKYKNNNNRRKKNEIDYAFEESDSDPDLSEDKINIISSMATENSCTSNYRNYSRINHHTANDVSINDVSINDIYDPDSSVNSISNHPTYTDREIKYDQQSYDDMFVNMDDI